MVMSMDNLKALQLKASLVNWRLFHLRDNDVKFKSTAANILAKNNYSCAFCGFIAQNFMSIVNLDGDYFNNKKDNLAPACPFCLQCGFIEKVGESGFGGGSLIYLPEMTQSELNMLCHTLFASLIQGGAAADSAKAMYRDLKLRVQIVDKQLGPGMSKPATFGKLLLDAPIMSDSRYKDADFLQQFRLLPTYTRFVSQLITWSREAIGFWGVNNQQDNKN
jgi:intracellular multiplication protein IcmJ